VGAVRCGAVRCAQGALTSCSSGLTHEQSTCPTPTPAHHPPHHTTHPTQYAWYEPLKDWYAAYNKPGAVVDYFEHFPNAPEDWVVVLDSDMLLKRPFVPEELPLERGWAYAAHYDYLVGTDNALALRHVPEVPPR
jgi:hypothetical protein